MPRLLTSEEITRQLTGLPGWEPSGDGRSIAAAFTFADFAGSLAFVNRVGREAEEMDHHPDVDIRWGTVTLTLSTHSEGGLTQLDVELAHRASVEAGRG